MAVERQINSNDIEAIVCRLKDVIAVSVVNDENGGIAEIHVLTGSSRSPKQVVRDVESAIQARLGIAIDHKKISIAQVAEGSARYDHSRLKFTDVSISFNGNRTEAVVHLMKDGVIYSGMSNGMSSLSSQMKLISSATIKAIENSELADFSIILEDVTDVMVAGKRVALVVLNAVTDRSEDLLTGSAVIKQDVWKGVVNATLDAVNRRLFLAADR